MKKKLLFKKVSISTLNQLRLTGGGKTETNGVSGYDPSDNATSECTIYSCDPNDNGCTLEKSIGQQGCP